MYLQNASDPITYWTFDLLWRRPEWLDDPRGPDGHGHVYGQNQADGWVAIYSDPQWTPADTGRTRSLITTYD